MRAVRSAHGARCTAQLAQQLPVPVPVPLSRSSQKDATVRTLDDRCTGTGDTRPGAAFPWQSRSAAERAPSSPHASRQAVCRGRRGGARCPQHNAPRNAQRQMVDARRWLMACMSAAHAVHAVQPATSHEEHAFDAHRSRPACPRTSMDDDGHTVSLVTSLSRPPLPIRRTMRTMSPPQRRGIVSGLVRPIESWPHCGRLIRSCHSCRSCRSSLWPLGCRCSNIPMPSTKNEYNLGRGGRRHGGGRGGSCGVDLRGEQDLGHARRDHAGHGHTAGQLKKARKAHPSVARGDEASGLRRIDSVVTNEDTASTIAVQMILGVSLTGG